MYRDADGHITYSNITELPPKGAEKIRCFEEARKPRAAAPEAERANTPRSANTDAFPKVDGETQRRRDDGRRRILEQELADETQRLQDAQQALAAQESVRAGDERNYQRYLDRVQPFREAVENHQPNVAAIRRDLAYMR